MVADGRLRRAELGGDLARCSCRVGQRSATLRRSFAICRLGASLAARSGVLLAGGVGQRDELVHLEERPRRLGHLDAHPPAARRVAFDVPVLDGLVEDRGQAVDELADRRRAEWPAPPTPVPQFGAGVDRAPQLGGFPQLVGLERQAELGVDLVEAVLAEERQQVLGQSPAVVALRVGVDRPVAEDAALFASSHADAYSWNVGMRPSATDGGGLRLRQTPARTFARCSRARPAAVRSFHPPPQPHWHLRRSWSVTSSRAGRAWKRSLNTRVPSASVLTITLPVAARPT